MAAVSEHYEKHLARYYAWISGGVELKIQENQKFFIDHNIQPSRLAPAFDLGAGSGMAAPFESVRTDPAERSSWKKCFRSNTLMYITANGNVPPCCISPFSTSDYP